MSRRNGLTAVRGFGSSNQEYTIEYDRWVFGRLIEAGPTTLNMMTNKMVPRGREVATPEVLRNLPLKPPGRS